MADITPQDKGEYDYEGDMVKSQLKSIIANAKRLHDMLKPESNLPEWVQSKVTLAEDYILTASNYMEGEMNEEMKPYVKAAQKKFDAQTKAQNMGKKQAGTLAAKTEKEKSKQAVFAQKAVDITKGKKNRINKEPKVEIDVKV
jgi:hypothetical protein